MVDDESLEFHHLIDRSVKALFRECPAAMMRLAGVTVAPDAIRVEDPNLNLPELRADHVFILPEGAIYMEYQLKPDSSLLPSWCAKWGGLMRQLGRNVALVVLYLQKGDYATFPDYCRVRVGALETKLQFNAIRLWEYAERIRSGEMPELAPLLMLCEENPTEQTIRDEVALIHDSALPEETQKELLAIALMVATRQFSRELLNVIFEEDMHKMEGITIIQDWIKKGYARGEAEGRAKGEAETAREMTLVLLTRKFGVLPDTLQKQIEAADAEWCRNLFDRAMRAETLAELNLDAPE